MKDLFVNRSLFLIKSKKELSHYDEVKLKYGLEVMYHFFTKLIVVIFLSLLFGFLVENIIFFIFYGLLRMFGYGIHAKTNIGCWISSVITYMLGGFIIKYYPFYINPIFIISIFLLVTLFSPADTSSKPLINKKTRIILKIYILIISLIYLSLYLLNIDIKIKTVIVLAGITQLIMVNPISYFLIGRTYHNYKNYNN